MKEKKVWFKNSKEMKLAGIIRIPDGNGPFPIVILCHGYTSSKDNLKNPAISNKLISANIATFVFDFHGHGESEGNPEDINVTQGIDDLNCAIEFVKKQNFDNSKIGVIGSSFGGFVAAEVASSRKDVTVLVLLAPMVDYEHARVTRLGKETIKKWKESGYLFMHGVNAKYIFFEEVQKYDLYKDAKRIKIPTLIIQGNKDITVPIIQNKKLYKILPSKKKLVWVDGCDHWFRGKHLEQVVKETYLWFNKYLK